MTETTHDIAVIGCLVDETHLAVPVVVNVAGPHSGAIKALACVGDDFEVKTRPLRQEVHKLRASDGYNCGGAAGPLQWLDDPADFNVKPTKIVYDAQIYRA